MTGSILEQVSAAVLSIVDPNTGKSLLTPTRLERSIRIAPINDDVAAGYHVAVDIALGYPALPDVAALRMRVQEVLLAITGVHSAAVNIYSKIAGHAAQSGMSLLHNIKNIIAVASGKGGVGKSTTAANLAVALSACGANVGILDADIYGPSQPLLFGLSNVPPPSTENHGLIKPFFQYGIALSSIGFLVDIQSPVIWRGPLVTRALEQLLTQTDWGDLDYLIVDMPPGTGDIHLTLAQKIPVTGAVIVTTPQDLALLDARRGLNMFQKMGISVLGILENMSGHRCSACGHLESVFGVGGGNRLSQETGVEYLGEIPLDVRIRSQTDLGKPVFLQDASGFLSEKYSQIAYRLAVKISQMPRAVRVPPIVVEKSLKKGINES